MDSVFSVNTTKMAIEFSYYKNKCRFCILFTIYFIIKRNAYFVSFAFLVTIGLSTSRELYFIRLQPEKQLDSLIVQDKKFPPQSRKVGLTRRCCE